MPRGTIRICIFVVVVVVFVAVVASSPLWRCSSVSYFDIDLLASYCSNGM